MRQLLFVINPIAGDMDKSQAKARIEQYCPEKNWQYQFLETSGEGDASRIEEAMAAFSPDTVVACGGDGTINLVAGILLGRKNYRLGILPMGSANGLATEFGISSNVMEALDVLESGKLLEIDALRIQGEHYCFHLADIGYNAKLVQSFEREGTRGQLGYARESVRTLRERPVNTYTLHMDGHSIEQEAVMITFANARRYGTGAFVNPHGRIDDGQFEVCIFKPWPRWYFFWLAILSFSGRLDESRYVKILSVTEARVEADSPLPLQIDGELYGETKEVMVEMVDEKVRVWVPEGYVPPSFGLE